MGGNLRSSERFDAVRHFSERAGTYEAEAFGQSAGLRHISRMELEAVGASFAGMQGARCLDVGVGSGRVTDVLRRNGAEVTALDASLEMIRVAQERFPDLRAVYARLGPRLPFRTGAFEGATAIRVLKYVERASWPATLAELRRVLAREGTLVIEVTNSRSLARWGYPGMDVQLASLDEVLGLLASAGFATVRVDPGVRLPFVAYRLIDGPLALRGIHLAEKGLGRVAGRLAGARSLILTCRAVGS